MGFILKRKGQKRIEEKVKDKRELVAAEFVIEQHFRVFSDSLKILETTTNPRTFFGRYNDLIGAVERIIDTSRTIKLKDTEEKGLEILEDITSEKTKTDMIIDFIDRCLVAGKEDVLRNEMSEYEDKMTEESIEYYKKHLF